MVANKIERSSPYLQLLSKPLAEKTAAHAAIKLIAFPDIKYSKKPAAAEPLPLRRIEKYKQPSAFSFLDTYENFAHWRTTYDYQEAASRIRWKLLGDLLALRNEGIGAQWTHDIVTEVVWSGHEKRFRNLQYKDGDDLIAMYQFSLAQLSPTVESAMRARYELEIAQTVAIWEATTEVLGKLTYGSPAEITHQLTNLGFVKNQLGISLGLTATFPELANNHTTSLEVLLGPPIITVSPPSLVHRQGESSFGWASRLVYIPNLRSFAIIQNGTFTAYTRQEISHFLKFHNLKEPNLSTETQIMEYLNLLPNEFTHKHSLAILNEIINHIGYFKSLPPIDKHIRPGDFSHEAHVEAMIAIFEFEYQQIQAKPELAATQAVRFIEWEKAIMHNAIAGFNDFNKISFVKGYKELYTDHEIALQPGRFAQKATSLIKDAYPSFSKVIDFSKLDCISGFFTKMSKTMNAQGLEGLIGLPATRMLLTAEKNGLQNESELNLFCNTFKLPRELFKANTEKKLCPGCVANGNTQPPKFIGPCVCAVCHAKDNLGLGVIPEPEVMGTELEEKQNKTWTNIRQMKKSVGITEVLNGDIYDDFIPQENNGIIDQWPPPAKTLHLPQMSSKPLHLAA